FPAPGSAASSTFVVVCRARCPLVRGIGPRSRSPMSEERRREMTKIVRHEGEQAKIAIRNLRRDANEAVKKLVKDKEATEDEQKRSEADIQKVTDRHVADIDALVAAKEKDIMEV
ncbi:MAG: ribosome recycling factor, partial [Ottowia sp.]